MTALSIMADGLSFDKMFGDIDGNETFFFKDESLQDMLSFMAQAPSLPGSVDPQNNLLANAVSQPAGLQFLPHELQPGSANQLAGELGLVGFGEPAPLPPIPPAKFEQQTSIPQQHSAGVVTAPQPTAQQHNTHGSMYNARTTTTTRGFNVQKTPGSIGAQLATTAVRRQPMATQLQPTTSTSSSVPSVAARHPLPKVGPTVVIGPDGKPHISHSVVEKQRRDRINSLIDELRDIVPPQAATAGELGSTDAKRPKHIVLADTIALVRELQEKVRLQDSAAALEHSYGMGIVGPSGLGPGGPAGFSPPYSPTQAGELLLPPVSTGAAVDLMRRTCPDASPPREHSSNDSDSRSAGACEMPQAPEGVVTWSGVIVEPGEAGVLYVKVNCKDRRGLLSDVIMALKALPLEIITAAITTTKEGNVFDVFEVVPDAGTGLTASGLQFKVHMALQQQGGQKRPHWAADSGS